jgi:hypothetical protein
VIASTLMSIGPLRAAEDPQEVRSPRRDFVLEVVEELDLGASERVLQSKDARGERPYPPRLKVALLVYAYSTGVFSSRAMYEDA